MSGRKKTNSETVLEREAGPSLEGRGLGQMICKEGLAELAQREAARIWPWIMWMEEERHCRWRGSGDETMGVPKWEIQDWGRWRATSLQLPPGL